MVQQLDSLGESWALHDEVAEAGYYAATLDTGVKCEITVGSKVAVHRYTFPEHRSARVLATTNTQLQGTSLATREGMHAWFAEAGLPAPLVIDLPSGATLVVAERA